MNPPKVAILDYSCGNLGSVVNAVRKVGGEPEIVYQGYDGNATHLILPGQGSFRTVAARHPDDWAWLNRLREAGHPILGICLGMQLMCEGSAEAPGVQGLGWFPRRVEKIPVKRLPHVGWNTVSWSGGSTQDFYFCHSYAVPGFVLDEAYRERGFTSWGTVIVEGLALTAALTRDNLWAVQFHPEKSGKAGLDLLAEFLKL